MSTRAEVELLMSLRLSRATSFGSHLVARRGGSFPPRDQGVDGFRRIRIGGPLRSRGMTGISSIVGIVSLGDGIFHEQLIQPEVGAGNGEVAFGGGHIRLVFHDLHSWNGVELKLLLIVVEGLLAKPSDRSLICSS